MVHDFGCCCAGDSDMNEKRMNNEDEKMVKRRKQLVCRPNPFLKHGGYGPRGSRT